MRSCFAVTLVCAVLFLILSTASWATPETSTGSPQAVAPSEPREMTVITGKSLVIDSPVTIQRVSVANGDIAEAVAISPREVLVNGKVPGETSLVIWQEGGNRLLFDLTVRANATRSDTIKRQLKQELVDQPVDIELDSENNVFVRGTVRDLNSAERAIAIVSTLGKPVNLLRVNVPAIEAQVLLKVRFANLDRAATTELGVNLFSTGALNTIGATSTGAFTSPRVTTPATGATEVTLTDALNVFLFRKDLDLGATIKALQSRRLLEILAEPNVLAINGRPASFLAGGEFPYPTLQGGGAGIGQVTIQFREFGVRINFLPRITPRGTIRLEVTPEVSALDYANALVFQGFTIPGLSTRRVQTEIELEDRQSFAIGGLLDNRVTESLSKIPGLGDIPLLGKLFQSKSLSKSNTELLVLVTPELVRPMPANQRLPEIQMPQPFMTGANTVPRTPAIEQTGQVSAPPVQESVPVEQLMEKPKPGAAGPAAPVIQYVPVPVAPPDRPASAPLTPRN